MICVCYGGQYLVSGKVCMDDMQGCVFVRSAKNAVLGGESVSAWFLQFECLILGRIIHWDITHS